MADIEVVETKVNYVVQERNETHRGGRVKNWRYGWGYEGDIADDESLKAQAQETFDSVSKEMADEGWEYQIARFTTTKTKEVIS